MKGSPAFFFSASAPVDPVTWNPSDKSANITLSSGNLIATRASGTTSYGGVRATSGKAYTSNGYFEVYIATMKATGYLVIGIGTSGATLSDYVGADAYGWSYYGAEGGKKLNNGSATAYGTDFVQGDLIGVAFNNGKVWFAKNNTWNGDPAADTGAAFTGITSTIFPMVALYYAGSPVDSVGGRFKSADFSYSPPSGFSAWES